MNLFCFLKNKYGKLTFGLPQMATIAGVGLIASYGAFFADKQAAEQEQIRALSSISGAYNYSGLRQSGRSGLTAINVKDGLSQVATAEERARLESQRTGGGDFGLSAADNLGSSVTGRAAEMSDTEGLGMGRNAVSMQTGGGVDNTVGGARVAPGAVSSRTGRPASSAETRQLSSVPVTRAGGSGISASYGAGSPRETSGAGSYGSGVNSGEGYRFSGAMPSGTDPLSLSGANGRAQTTFMSGGRHATSGRGRQSRNTGNELKDIAKRSADAAANRNRSDNEGARAFLASAKNSGGMNIDSSVGGDEAGSADFSTPEMNNIKSIGDWGEQQIQNTETKRDKDRNKLLTWMITLVAATAVAIPLLRWLSTASETTGLFGLSFGAWAWVVFGVVAGLAAVLSTLAGIYWHNYGFSWMSMGAFGVSLACVGYALYTLMSGLAGKLGQGHDVYENRLVESLKGYGMTGASKLGEFGLNELKNADAKKTDK